MQPDMGPVNHRAASRPRGESRRERREGRRESDLRRARRAIESAPNGFYMGATIVDQVRDEMTLAREEVFGPVLNVMRMDDLDHAIEAANKSASATAPRSSLTLGKPRANLSTASKAGMVGINVGVPATMAMFPFTGWDDSFYGDLHIQGKEAVQFYTQQKVGDDAVVWGWSRGCLEEVKRIPIRTA